ncbi:MAG: phytanoyl-CoA dioxygenase family protein [Armatimonadetes bacterium]|nr:phytanoyl-CoA dioxygenase family protein [Armatimonadota bacterium]
MTKPMTTYRVLTDEDVAQFLQRGFVKLPQAVPPDIIAEYTANVWERLGYDPDRPDTWEKHWQPLPHTKGKEVREISPVIYDAICDLCGEDRIGKAWWGDSLIVNLGRAEDEAAWEPPTATAPGWHTDGDFFKHFLDSPEQGLLTIVLWSDVTPRNGATFVVGDSVPHVAKHFAAHPEGLMPNDLSTREHVQKCTDFFEATGEAGDVYLLHPFVIHASSRNATRRLRLITNPPVHLKEPMNFNRPDGDYSLVERAILNGLGVPHYDFQPTAPREKVETGRERAKREAEAAKAAS